MYPETLQPKTREVLEKVKSLAVIDRFYLAGGTSLALQLGHRESLDLDFFSEQKLMREIIKSELSKMGNYSIEAEDEETLDGILDGVKVSFFYHPYSQLYPFQEFDGIKIADERDIAAMKINAISNRGSKKDFIDIYFLAQKYTLPQLITFFEKKYSGINYNKLHILKSLTYFEEANDPMPKMLKPVEWEEVKKFIEKEAMKIS